MNCEIVKVKVEIEHYGDYYYFEITPTFIQSMDESPESVWEIAQQVRVRYFINGNNCKVNFDKERVG